ncbi:MAG: sigma-54 dependent transcriptional regulator [Rhodothermaceae bacterium]|nr:sigma-54 dependent transcriptional regulator [Rhodothermaceae bacterium]
MKYGTVLVVDDDPDILQAARLLLKKHVSLVETTENPSEIPKLMKHTSYDVILLDMNFARGNNSGKEGFHWLEQIVSLDPSVAVIMITAFGDVETAVHAIKEGATDFVLKPWQNDRLITTILNTLQLHQSKKEVDQLRAQKHHLSEAMDSPYKVFIGESQVMLQVFNTIRKVAPTDANVLILGENGTGKELVARAIHRQSNRSNEVFVTVDLGAVSETLFESELFGHAKGAFTDAREDRAGRFEAANEGTLFLDEIGNLSLPLQAKLLSALQNRSVIRLGTNKPRPIDVRLICATNMPLYEMSTENNFRQDLLYRINTVEIKLPPLRDRGEDLPILANHFLSVFARKYKKSAMRMGGGTIKKLASYPWPGNVRELQHAIERAVILSDSSVLQPEDFLLVSPEPAGSNELTFESYNLEEVEKHAIKQSLKKNNGNISHAARELGLTRAALYRRLEKYGL